MSLKKRPTASSGSMEPRTTFWTTSRPRRSRWWRSAARNSPGPHPHGLTSYYLRASKTYDTLLQMGRWFGYRQGYLDATRLYTTPELIKYYVHITRASRELMELTSAVAKAGQTPRHVGLRVLDGGKPAGDRRGEDALLAHDVHGFSGQRAETLVMRTDKGPMTRNFAKLQELVEQIAGTHRCRRNGSRRRAGPLPRDVPAEVILGFLEGFDVSPRVLAANPENMAEYIRAQLAHGELARWTVAVAAGKSDNKLPGEEGLPLIQRRPITGKSRIQATECEVGVLVSPAHEALGIPVEEAAEAFRETEEGVPQAWQRRRAEARQRRISPQPPGPVRGAPARLPDRSRRLWCHR